MLHGVTNDSETQTCWNLTCLQLTSCLTDDRDPMPMPCHCLAIASPIPARFPPFPVSPPIRMNKMWCPSCRRWAEVQTIAEAAMICCMGCGRVLDDNASAPVSNTPGSQAQRPVARGISSSSGGGGRAASQQRAAAPSPSDLLRDAASTGGTRVYQAAALPGGVFVAAPYKFGSPQLRAAHMAAQLPAASLAPATPAAPAAAAAAVAMPEAFKVRADTFSPPRAGGFLRGVRNSGNTCFISSMLKVLSNTKRFTATLESDQLQRLKLDDETLTRSLQRFCRDANDGNRRAPPIDVAHVAAALAKKDEHWGNGRQEDVHEFFLAAAAASEAEVLDGVLRLQVQALEQSGVDGGAPGQPQLDWSHVAAGGPLRVPLSQLPCPFTSSFTGCLLLARRCQKCNHQTHRQERFNHLSIELPSVGATADAGAGIGATADPAASPRADADAGAAAGATAASHSLQSLLSATIFRPETMLLDCEMCGSVQAHEVLRSLQHAPGALVLHLKRFAWCQETQTRQKLTTPVEPDTRLELPLAPRNTAVAVAAEAALEDGGLQLAGAAMEEDAGGPAAASADDTASRLLALARAPFELTVELMDDSDCEQQPAVDASAAPPSAAAAVVYNLYAAVRHLGERPDAGHYVSYVKGRSKWHCHDDINVTYTLQRDVLQQSACEGYMFFYVKRQ